MYQETHLMWFGPGVQVVAHVPVAGPTKWRILLINHLSLDILN